MNKQNTEKLFKAHPWIAPPRDAVQENGFIANLMVFGIMCGDGWYELLDETCTAIERAYEDYIGVNPDDEFKLQAVEIKEKYGTLRFYMNMGEVIFDPIISFAESMSARTCEECGERGQLCSSTKDGGWYQTLCPKCMKENKYFVVKS